MKKKFILLTIIIGVILSLSSCRIQFPSLSYGQTWVHSLDYEFTETDKELINNRMAYLDELVTGDSYQTLYNEYIRFIKGDVYSLSTYQSQAYIKYSIDLTMESYNEYSDINDYLLKISEWEKAFYKKIYNSSFKDQFFEGYTEEEILKLIKEYPKEYYDIEENNSKLYAEYEAIDNLDDPRVVEIYKKLVVNLNKQARLCGYEDYRDFAYENVYERDFTYRDTIEFSNNVALYGESTFVTKATDFKKAYASASTKNSRAVASFIEDKYTAHEDEFEAFAREIGGSYYLAYQSLFNNGYYYFADTGSMEGAYTTYLDNKNTPACYFGPGYQDISTVVHEFGHYYSMLQRGNGSGSLDLAETQSQANEALFLAYLVSHNKLSEKTLSMVKDYVLTDLLLTLVLSSIVNDFENIVYSTENISLLDLDQTFINICEKYAGYDTLKTYIGNDFYDYWRYVTIDNPLYYISYSVGLVPAINLYILGIEDFEAAAKAYNNIVIYDYNNMSFLDVLDNAGLANPFDINSFTTFVTLYDE